VIHGLLIANAFQARSQIGNAPRIPVGWNRAVFSPRGQSPPDSGSAATP